MTLTIQLPDKLASRFMALLPEDQRDEFSVSAIADALMIRESEMEDCVTVVEQALADMDAGRGLIALEDLRRQWDAEEAAQKAGHTP